MWTASNASSVAYFSEGRRQETWARFVIRFGCSIVVRSSLRRQLEFSAPGDMVHLKHSPAMRSYVVLTGKVLISKNLLDREGVEVIIGRGAHSENVSPSLKHEGWRRY